MYRAHLNICSVFYTLIALLSLVAFVVRIYHLRTACMPHQFGRTAWIYWPTQIFIILAALTMFALAADAFLNEPSLSIQVLASIAMGSTLVSIPLSNRSSDPELWTYV